MNNNFMASMRRDETTATTANAATTVHSTGHIVIPDEVGLPGTAPSLLLIFVEETLDASSHDRITARDENGSTVLHVAAMKCAPIAFVDNLLSQHRARVNNCVDYRGNTPLHAACNARAYEHAKLLLTKGAADITLCNGDGELAAVDFLGDELPAETKKQLDRMRRHPLVPFANHPLCSSQTVFCGDVELLRAASLVAKFEMAVPLRDQDMPWGSDLFENDATNNINNNSSSNEQTTTTPTTTTTTLFAVVPRVTNPEAFLVGGMVLCRESFLFDGMPFCFREVLIDPDVGLHVALFVSLESGHSPIVLELLTSSVDSSLPTVMRCFRDVSGSLAAVDKQRQLLLDAAANEQQQQPQQQQQNDQKNNQDDESVKKRITLKTLQAQAEGRACAVLRRTLSKLHYSNRFRHVMFATGDRMLVVRSFLQRNVVTVTFSRGVLFFVVASFLRYCYNELEERFPTQCALYQAVKQVVRSMVLRIQEEQFVSNSWLYTAITDAMRARQQRLLKLLKQHRRAAPQSAASQVLQLMSRRDRTVWALTIEEVVFHLVQSMPRRDVAPVVMCAEHRDGFLPRSMLFTLRQRPDAKDVFEEMSRSKLTRTLCDMAQCFRGRKNYLQFALSRAGELSGGLRGVSKQTDNAMTDLPESFMTSPFRFLTPPRNK